MAFERITQPDPDQYVEPDAIVSIDSLVLPPVGLFAPDLYYWRTQLTNPDTDAHQAIAIDITPDLEALAVDQNTIAGFRDALDDETVQAWYSVAASVVAMSRLWRELPLDLMRDEMQVTDDTDDSHFHFDVSHEEIGKSALYMSAGVLEQLGLGLVPTSKDRWYDGQDVFVRTSTAVTPTHAFLEQWIGQFGHFDSSELVSVTARLKTSIWTAD